MNDKVMNEWDLEVLRLLGEILKELLAREPEVT